MKSNLSASSLGVCALGDMFNKPLPNPKSWKFTSMCSSKSFMVLTLRVGVMYLD